MAAISVAEPNPSLARGARVEGLIWARGGFGRAFAVAATGAIAGAGEVGRVANRLTGASPTGLVRAGFDEPVQGGQGFLSGSGS